uniref:hypothetical protein n=1 Tax=Phocaeicola sp. TaxID=2773926 RepID=UPI00402683E1
LFAAKIEISIMSQFLTAYRRFLLYGLFAIAAYVIKMQLKKKRGSIVCYDTPFFNLSEFYQVAMIILLPE